MGLGRGMSQGADLHCDLHIQGQIGKVVCGNPAGAADELPIAAGGSPADLVAEDVGDMIP